MAYALVTGSSSGIGRALSLIFAREGWDLVVSARRGPELEELAAEIRARYGRDARVLVEDLTREGGAQSLFDRCSELDIACLVNNAGFGDYGEFAASEPERNRNMVRLNVEALTELSRLFVPAMMSRREGWILNVASVAAFQPGPLMAVYYATKAYVLSLSEALANELAEHGITVSALCPGPTKSEFQERASMQDVAFATAEGIPTSEAVAEYGYRALMKGKRVAVHGLAFRLSVFFERFLPRRVVTAATRALQERRRS